MDGTVPRDVDDADELSVISSADPPEAVSMDLGFPVPVIVAEDFVLERLRMRASTSELSKSPRQSYLMVTPPTLGAARTDHRSRSRARERVSDQTP